MITSSPELATALSSAISVAIRVEWSPNWLDWYPLQPISGSTDQDATQSSRWKTSGSFAADTPVGLDGIHALGCRLRAWLEVTSLGRSPIRIPYGEYTIKRATPGRESIQIEGLSHETRVVVAQFPRPRTVPDRAGWSRRQQVERLVVEAVPDARFRWLVDGGSNCPTATVDEDRWQLVDGSTDKVSLLDGLGARLHCDALGMFVIAPVPTVDASATVWAFTQGSGGSLVATPQSIDSDSVANVVVAVGTPQSNGSGPSETIGPVYAWDSDPTSLTYAGPDPLGRPELAGRFGVVPTRISSPLLETLAAAQLAAETRLRQSLGSTVDLAFDALLQPALEVGDVVSVEVEPGHPTPHLIDKLSWKWGSPTMTATTRVQSISTRFGITR